MPKKGQNLKNYTFLNFPSVWKAAINVVPNCTVIVQDEWNSRHTLRIQNSFAWKYIIVYKGCLAGLIGLFSTFLDQYYIFRALKIPMKVHYLFIDFNNFIHTFLFCKTVTRDTSELLINDDIISFFNRHTGKFFSNYNLGSRRAIYFLFILLTKFVIQWIYTNCFNTVRNIEVPSIFIREVPNIVLYNDLIL